MPKPEGWSDAQLAKRDEIVTSLLADPEFKGRGSTPRKQRAYQVATAQVNEMGNPYAGDLVVVRLGGGVRMGCVFRHDAGQPVIVEFTDGQEPRVAEVAESDVIERGRPPEVPAVA